MVDEQHVSTHSQQHCTMRYVHFGFFDRLVRNVHLFKVAQMGLDNIGNGLVENDGGDIAMLGKHLQTIGQ